jgi:High-affinity nickel-transport protein
MFGLDEQLAGLGQGEVFAVVALIAVLLGLRHATDPDHLTAVSTLVAGDGPSARSAGRLGFAWGMGHATSLVAFGIPIVLSSAYLPDAAQTGAETAVGIVIIALAVRLLLRWRRGEFDHHAATPRPARSPLQAYGIGLLHGMGGSAGVGVLLLAPMTDHAEALAALVLFALFTAVSMAAASSTFGLVLSRGPVLRSYVAVVPALAALSLAFGAWYALGALNAAPYIF